jgi:hypothetical protein
MHRHPTPGFVYFSGTGVVTWSSKKQPIVTLSSTEAEYVALTRVEGHSMDSQITEISSVFSFTVPTTLYCDNQGAIRLSKDSTFHGRTKHIDVHFHFIRQTVTSGHIVLRYWSTNDMIGDIFTKSLARVEVREVPFSSDSSEATSISRGVL